MCGLTGVISRYLNHTDMRVFTELMTVSTLRGADGAGVAVVPKNKKHGGPRVYRSEDSGANLIHEAEFGKFAGCHPCVMAGHTRYPTGGGHTKEFIHPIVNKEITLLHNGTMKTVAGVKVGKDDFDSAMLAAAIQSKPLKEVFTTSEGDMALVWFDNSSETINFYRNKGRTLYFSHIEEGPETVYWASEIGMLRFILGRRVPDKKFKVIALPVDTHWAMKWRTNSVQVSLQENRKYGEEPLSLPTKPTFYKTYGDKGCTKTDLDIILKKGCINCNEPQSTIEYWGKQLKWISESTFVCSRCHASDEGARALVDKAADKNLYIQ
jgi:predicted glutamine amidotransferase